MSTSKFEWFCDEIVSGDLVSCGSSDKDTMPLWDALEALGGSVSVYVRIRNNGWHTKDGDKGRLTLMFFGTAANADVWGNADVPHEWSDQKLD